MLHFTKMHGLGNDYVFIYCNDYEMKNLSDLAIELSNRNFGVGSDGLIVISKSFVADFKMRIFNSDGSEATMCGNGIRCVGKYVFDNKFTMQKKITVETKSGIKTLELFVNNENLVEKIKVSMGTFKFLAKISIIIDDKEFEVNCVDAGNLHGVIFTHDNVHESIEKYGKKISEYSKFKDGINVEFVKIIDNTKIEMAVYERGSGITLACGTGASASYFLAYLNNFVLSQGIVNLKFGNLEIDVKPKNKVYMTGPAKKVFDGEYYN